MFLHRQIPCACSVKCFHDLFHLLVAVQCGGGEHHQVFHGQFVVPGLVEHDGPDFFEWNNANEFAVCLKNRVDVAFAFGHHLHKLSQCHVRTDRIKVSLDLIRELHEGENGLVLVVGNQFSSVGQFLRVNAVGSHPPCSLKGNGTGEHERDKQVVPSAGLGGKKDGGKRRPQDARHETGHAGEHKVSADEVPTGKQKIGGQQKDAAQQRPTHQRRGEHTTDSSGANGEACECWFTRPQYGHDEQRPGGRSRDKTQAPFGVERGKLAF